MSTDNMKEKKAKFNELFPPNKGYEYFQERDIIPIQASPIHTAWWLAESSLLAYDAPDVIKWVLRAIGAKHFQFFSWETTQVAVFVIEEICIVTFRGTEWGGKKGFTDLMSDLQFEMVPFLGSKNNAHVHRGFLEAFEETLDPGTGLTSYVDSLWRSGDAKQVLFTGHSLGGALATVASAFHRGRYETPGIVNEKKTAQAKTPLFTFGAPRTGNPDFISLLPEETYRFVTKGDPIPYLPPNIPGMTTDEIFYSHPPEGLHYFHNSNTLELNPQDIPKDIGELLGTGLKATIKNAAEKAASIFVSGPESTGERLKNFALSVIRNSNMDAHAPVLYAIYLYNSLLKQKQFY